MKESEIDKAIYPMRATRINQHTVRVRNMRTLEFVGDVYKNYDDAYREAEYRNKIYWGART